MQQEWNYDELDDIYFQKSDNELACLKQQRGCCLRNGPTGLPPTGKKIYNGDQGKFLKSLQELMNWEMPQNEISEHYTNMMNIGFQPNLIELRTLDTIDEHLEWKMERDVAREHKENEDRIRREKEEVLNQRHKIWRKEQEMFRKKALARKKAAAESYSPSKHQRRVTVKFELAADDSSNTSQFQRQETQPVLAEQTMKKFDTASRKSEYSEAPTAETSNYRFLRTPSPSKTTRNPLKFSQNGDNVMKATNLKLNNLNIKIEDINSTGLMSPSNSSFAVSTKNEYMPRMTLFEFANKNKNPFGVQSSRANNRGVNSQLSSGNTSSPMLRMNNLMRDEYDNVENNMIKKF